MSCIVIKNWYTGYYICVVPSDSELLGSMSTRLATVEQELLAAKREIVEKVPPPIISSQGPQSTEHGHTQWLI